MEVGCFLWWVEDILQWRHPTVTVVDTNCDTSVLWVLAVSRQCTTWTPSSPAEQHRRHTQDINHCVLTMKATETSHTQDINHCVWQWQHRDITHKRTTTLSDNDSNTDVTHKTTTTVSDNDNTQTSHTKHQPLGPDNDSNTYVTYKRTTTLSNNDSNTDVTHKTTTTVSDNNNTHTSHTRHQPLGPDNDSNTYVTYKTTTTVSDNDNTETSHTRQHPLCLTMTTQRRHIQDNNHCIWQWQQHRHHTQDNNHCVWQWQQHRHHIQNNHCVCDNDNTETSHTYLLT